MSCINIYYFIDFLIINNRYSTFIFLIYISNQGKNHAWVREKKPSVRTVTVTFSLLSSSSGSSSKSVRVGICIGFRLYANTYVHVHRHVAELASVCMYAGRIRSIRRTDRAGRSVPRRSIEEKTSGYTNSDRHVRLPFRTRKGNSDGCCVRYW